MNNKKWNDYFYSHYHPEHNEWGQSDLKKYRQWYTSWISYLKFSYNFSFEHKRAIELGCGIGAFSTLLHDEGCKVTGTDIAEVMVRHAKKISPDIDFLTYDVMEPFPGKEKFDYVIAFEVLEHIPKLDLAVRNIFDVLQSGGYFIGSTPYPYKKNMVDPTHVNVHLPEYWKTLFVSNGFTDVMTIPMSFFPLIWKIPPYMNPVVNSYIKYPGFVSTTLILAKK